MKHEMQQVSVQRTLCNREERARHPWKRRAGTQAVSTSGNTYFLEGMDMHQEKARTHGGAGVRRAVDWTILWRGRTLTGDVGPQEACVGYELPYRMYSVPTRGDESQNARLGGVNIKAKGIETFGKCSSGFVPS